MYMYALTTRRKPSSLPSHGILNYLQALLCTTLRYCKAELASGLGSAEIAEEVAFCALQPMRNMLIVQ